MGFWDFNIGDLVSPWASYRLPASNCAAVAVEKTKPFERDAVETMEAWKVQRLYYIADFQGILQEVVAMLNEASQGCLDVYADNTVWGDTGAQSLALEQYQKINREFLSVPSITGGAMSAQPFIDALVAGAKAGKKAVEAPDFKAWVGLALIELRKAYALIEFSACRKSVWQRVVEKIAGHVEKLLGIVKTAVEFVIQVGQTIADVAITVATGAFTAFRYLKYGLYAVVLGGAGYLGYKGYKAVRARLPGTSPAELPSADDEEVA